MKKNLTICLAVAGVFIGLVSGAVYAHVPADRTFLAFQWPDSYIPKIDGNLSEWDIIPDVYRMTNEDTHEALYARPIDKSDFDITRGYVGYNLSNQLIYMATEVFDNLHESDNVNPGDCKCSDDNFEFWLDADHAGDKYVAPTSANPSPEESKRATNSLMQWYSMAVPPVGLAIQSGGSGTWANQPPYMELGWTFAGEEFGESTYRYELYVTPWDDLDWQSSSTSTKSILKENNIIGLNLIWSDYDYEKNETGGSIYHGYWITGGTCCDGERAADFLLAPMESDLFPTAVEAQTWGRIKTRFVN